MVKCHAKRPFLLVGPRNQASQARPTLLVGHLSRTGFPACQPAIESDAKHMQIMVRENNVDQALRALKKKLQREGVYREMKMRRHYEKPSEKRAREKAAAVRRARKMDRKRAERDGTTR
jgi:small subunit ribosomal protein S21